MQVKNKPEYCKGCEICILVCPMKVFETGKELSDRGYYPPTIAHPLKCPNAKRRTKKNAVSTPHRNTPTNATTIPTICQAPSRSPTGFLLTGWRGGLYCSGSTELQ